MGRFGLPPSRLDDSRWLLMLLGGLVAMGIAGCGETSFLGRQYSNFTAYYNKFHNAEAAFEKGVQSLEESTRPVDRSEYVSIFLDPGEEGTGSNSSFDQAIQKSADVLREHPESKWVDDALLLIGKSYYYQNNYIGAAQKFREVLALDSERRLEARFWLARTLVANEQYSAADEVLRVLETDQGPLDNRWTAQLLLVQAELLVQQEEWTAAANALERGLSGDLPERPAARGAFLLGQVRETIGAPGQARLAYQQVQDHDPSYNLGLAARLSDIELQGAHGNAKEALDRLDDLESDDKNFEKRGEIALVRARVYRAMGQYDRARATLRGMLYQEEAPSGTVDGRLHYDLATLYRDAYKDFSRAAAHFDTASTGLQQGGPRSQAEAQRLPEAPVDATEQADRYRNLAERAGEVARMDSLLRIGRLSDEEFEAFVQELRQKRLQEQEDRQQARQETGRSQRFRERGQALGDRQRGASAADTRQSDAGFLFHQDPARVQKGRQRFQEIWGDRPRVDNWRRRNAIRSSQTADADETTEQPSESDEAVAPSPTARAEGTALDLSGIPRDSSSQAKMEAERAVARYELANSLFLAAGRPDSAATWYRRILQQNAEHPVAKRALYALAEAYSAQGDTTAAQQAYQRLVEQHPDTPLAMRARQRLDRSSTTSGQNEVAIADSAYADAYNRWQEGAWRPALDSLLSIAGRHPGTQTAPRALLASGIIYWRQTKIDSTTVPRSLVTRYLQRFADRSLGESPSNPLERGERTGQGDSTVSSATLPDALGAPTDSLASGPRGDSAQAEGLATSTRRDSIRATSSATPQTDSIRQAPSDTLQTGTVSSREVPTRVRAGRDSIQDAPDSVRAGPNEGDVQAGGAASPSAGAADVYAPLKSLLDHLTKQYADAPQAERARTILAMIEEQRSPSDSARTDSGTVATADSDSAGRSRSEDARLGNRVPSVSSDGADTTRTSRSSDRQENAPTDADSAGREEDQAALPAPGDPDTQSERPRPNEAVDRGGGWTIIVDRFSSSRDASQQVSRLRQKLGSEWNVQLLQRAGTEDEEVLLVVGRYATEAVAGKVKARLQEEVSGPLEVYQRTSGDSQP